MEETKENIAEDESQDGGNSLFVPPQNRCKQVKFDVDILYFVIDHLNIYNAEGLEGAAPPWAHPNVTSCWSTRSPSGS